MAGPFLILQLLPFLFLVTAERRTAAAPPQGTAAVGVVTAKYYVEANDSNATDESFFLSCVLVMLILKPKRRDVFF